MASIGKLTEVDVRELWAHEQYDFSNWLAKEANLEYLNDILGLTLTTLTKKCMSGHTDAISSPKMKRPASLLS